MVAGSTRVAGVKSVNENLKYVAVEVGFSTFYSLTRLLVMNYEKRVGSIDAFTVTNIMPTTTLKSRQFCISVFPTGYTALSANPYIYNITTLLPRYPINNCRGKERYVKGEKLINKQQQQHNKATSCHIHTSMYLCVMLKRKGSVSFSVTCA